MLSGWRWVPALVAPMGNVQLSSVTAITPAVLPAVTTGPVTVPILLALGIGVMTTSRQRRRAKAALTSSVANNTGEWSRASMDGAAQRGVVRAGPGCPAVAALTYAYQVACFMHSIH